MDTKILKTPSCLFPGCHEPVAALGYCSAHYQQLKAGKELTSYTPRTWNLSSQDQLLNEDILDFGMKKCSVCKRIKFIDEFHKNRRYKNGRPSQCKECASDKQREMKYGLSRAQYDRMLRRQGGQCAVCSNASGDINLVVDHSHHTGKVRGILCRSCNTMLGLAGDRTETLKSAIRYIRKHIKRHGASP